MKKVCIVGCGAISKVHALAVKKAQEAELYAVCDINKERANSLANKYKVKAIYNFDEVISDENIEAVHICTPHYLHANMAVKALAAGKYVVLEKPAAMNRAELNMLKGFSDKYGGKLCLILQNRYNGCVKMLKKLVEDETNGKMLGAKAFVTWHRDKEYYAQDEWRGKWATEGGGVLINQAVHTLDLLGWLCGGIKAVKASMSTKALCGAIEVEDTLDAYIELKNGVFACFYATNGYGLNSPVCVEINFENVTYRYADNYLYKIENDKSPEVISGKNIDVEWKSYWGDGHTELIQNFYKQAAGFGNNYISLDDGFNSSAALFAIYESAKNGGIRVETE